MTSNSALSLAAIAALGIAFPAPSASADGLPFEGFLPMVGLGLTDEFKDSASSLDGMFFIADPSTSPGGFPLPTSGAAYYDLALFDTGAATHILTEGAAGPSGFDIAGSGFGGTNFQEVGGATGTISLSINDPHGVYVAGLADRLADTAPLSMTPSALRGQTSVATLSAPAEWTLPNIVGLPMAAQHAVHIRNSLPQIFSFAGQTVRTPQIDLLDLGAGSQQGIQRRAPLILSPGLSFLQGPLYVYNLDLFSTTLHDNPLSPTVVENGGLFIEVDLENGSDILEDKPLFFDTGASLTVLSEQTAVRLGFDPVIDAPDFVLTVEGSGGSETGIPGIFLDRISIDTIGGSFELTNVPVAVLDVADPTNPGNVIDGIVGMNLFTGRDLVIDANPATGQGGVGPSLYISDPVWTDHQWASTAASETWSTAANWSTSGTPDSLWWASVGNVSGSDQEALVSGDSTVFRAVVSGSPGATMTVRVASSQTLTTFADLEVQDDGQVLLDGGRIDVQFVQLNGGTLSGDGTVAVGSGPFEGSVRNLGGRIAPGGAAGNPIGTITIAGSLTGGAAGTTTLDLGGTVAGVSHDQIVVLGSLLLGGSLDLARLDLGGGLFDPPLGTTITVLTATDITGEFAGLPNGAIVSASGASFAIGYTATTVTLERVAQQDEVIGEVEVLSIDQIELKFTGTPGANYEIEFTDDLAPPVTWTSIGTFPADSSGIVTSIQNIESDRRFYRAVRN